MANIRTRKTANFSVISNTILTDTNLSWEARGMAAYVLSKPDGWIMNTSHLMTQSPSSGRDRILRMAKELEDHGYLVRKTSRKPDGTFVHLSDLYEEPQSGFAGVGKAEVGKAEVGKGDSIVNTDLSNTDLNKNLYNNSKGGFPHVFPERMETNEERCLIAVKHGVPISEISSVWFQFSNYYRSTGAKRVNWDLAWESWCERAGKRYHTPPPSSDAPPPHRRLTKREERHYDNVGLQHISDILGGALGKIGGKGSD